MSVMETEGKVEAGLLFCLPRMLRYYESLAWQVLESSVVIEQPSGKIASPLRVMVLPFGGMNWPPGLVELQSFPW